MVVFLLLLLLEKNFSFTGAKTRRLLLIYHIGLNLTAVMLVVRGVTQVLGVALSSSMSAVISGIAGIGHILLGVSLLLLLLQVKRSMSEMRQILLILFLIIGHSHRSGRPRIIVTLFQKKNCKI